MKRRVQLVALATLVLVLAAVFVAAAFVGVARATHAEPRARVAGWQCGRWNLQFLEEWENGCEPYSVGCRRVGEDGCFYFTDGCRPLVRSIWYCLPADGSSPPRYVKEPAEW